MRKFLAAFAFGMLVYVPVVSAQGVDMPLRITCFGPTATMKVDALQLKDLGQKPLFDALDYEKDKIRVYVNPETGAWTMVMFEKDKTCIVTSGIGFEPAKPPKDESL